MNSSLFRYTLILILITMSMPSWAVLMEKPVSEGIEKNELTEEGTSKVVHKSFKGKKLFKRISWVKRLAAKMNNSFGSVFSSSKFRLGALLLLVGIALAVVTNILSWPQILGWLAGAIGVAGIVLLVWSLIEYS